MFGGVCCSEGECCLPSVLRHVGLPGYTVAGFSSDLTSATEQYCFNYYMVL